MTGPRALLLANNWTPKVDPTGWWVSDKLDGIRAYWDGQGGLWSRLGKRFVKAPQAWLAQLPVDVPLDGELYLGPLRFNDTVRAVKGCDGWQELRYVVFDAPADPQGYENRIRHAAEQWRDVTPVVECNGLEHLWSALREAEAKGLEGIMLRQPESLYVGKRSRTLLKVKSFVDTEATVVAHIPGKGKHIGRLGALHCLLDDGTPFNVGTGFTDVERSDPPDIGSRVTVKYQELTPAGVPRFPTFVTVRDYE